MCRPHQPARPIGLVRPSRLRGRGDGGPRKVAARVTFAASKMWMFLPTVPITWLFYSRQETREWGVREKARGDTAADQANLHQYVEHIDTIKDADAKCTHITAVVRDNYRSRDIHVISRDKGACANNVAGTASCRYGRCEGSPSFACACDRLRSAGLQRRRTTGTTTTSYYAAALVGAQGAKATFPSVRSVCATGMVREHFRCGRIRRGGKDTPNSITTRIQTKRSPRAGVFPFYSTIAPSRLNSNLNISIRGLRIKNPLHACPHVVPTCPREAPTPPKCPRNTHNSRG